MQCVMITGAAGTIGTILRDGLAGHFPVLRLVDISELGEAVPGEELVAADICDMAALGAAMENVDAVVHLAAIPHEDAWERVLEVNIKGTFNVFEAARQHGVSRIVFASTNHVTGFYRRGQDINASVPLRPDTRYGLSKAFGENLGRFYADKYGIGVMCMRIGTAVERPTNERMLSTWISPDDLVRLVKAGLDAPTLHFAVAYGASANDRSWWDNREALALGYQPQDNAEDFAGEIMAMDVTEEAGEVARLFQGGPFVSIEFDGDPAKV